MESTQTQKLKQDLQTVVVDAEDLLKATASQTGERIETARIRAEESLRAARVRLEEAGAAIGQSARAAVRNVDAQVQMHPYVTAGVAAGIGLLIGLLIARR